MKIGYLLTLLLLLWGCRGDTDREPIPYVHVNRTLNLNNPSYNDLNPMGGYIYLDEGYRGVIVMHTFEGTFVAYERACTYHPHEDCAAVTVRKSGIEIGCGKYEVPEGKEDEEWQECCGSHFHTNGNVLEGPASYPLKQYRTMRDGSLLTITN